MGFGSYDYKSSRTRSLFRAETGSTGFDYSESVERGEAVALHPELDFRTKKMRESRDCEDKGPSTPIAVFCDVTGSMSTIPVNFLKDMHKLMKTIIDGKVVEDPQILFGGIGDANFDKAPCQFGEFEADDQKADACLGNLYLEGGGGINDHESYDLILYAFAKHVFTDAFEKRNEKGFLFIIGDEGVSPTIKAEHVKATLGIDLEQDIPTASVIEELLSKFHVIVLRPGGTTCFVNTKMRGTWTALLPSQNVIDVENPHDLLPTIAGIITKVSVKHDLDSIKEMLRDSGFSVSDVLERAIFGVS